jgi:hypothetical protein
MTFSGGGRGPHIWVPRRLSGLGDLTPDGRFLLPPDAGTVVAGVRTQAQGYLTQTLADQGRTAFRQKTGIDMPWVPTKPNQIGPWAKQQAQLYGTKAFGDLVDQGRRVFEDKLSGVVLPGESITHVYADIKNAMPEGDIEQWATDYITVHGPPTTPEQALAMGRAFVTAQCDQIGLPPEFIAASNMISQWPTSVEGAESWAITMGTAYLSQFGVPIVSSADPSGFLKLGARAAIAQFAPGVNFTMLEVGFDFWTTGSMSAEQAKGLVIGVAGMIGGIVGQAFGLPAPIGAFLAQIIVGPMVGAVFDAFGWGESDSEKLQAAQAAAEAAAREASRQCTNYARALWLEYQHYWQSIEDNLNATIHANQEWLLLKPDVYCSPPNGIRLFPALSDGENRIQYVIASDGKVVRDNKGNPQTYPYPVERTCFEDFGCPYLLTRFDPPIYRDSYGYPAGDPAGTARDLARVPTITQGMIGCDAISALAFWNARRYVTPMQVMYAAFGMATSPNQWIAPPTRHDSQFEGRNTVPYEEVMHSDEDYLTNVIGKVTTINFGTGVGNCNAPQWAGHMFRTLQQTCAALSLVQRDITRTVNSAVTQYEMQSQMNQLVGGEWTVASNAQKRAAAQAAVARTAAMRHAMLEAKRKGQRAADFLNYGLLAAGGGAVAGWAASAILKRRGR